MTSLIRRSVPRSRPLTTDSTSALGARYGAQPSTVVRRWRRRGGEDRRGPSRRRAPRDRRSATTRAGQVDAGQARSLRPVAAIRAAVSGEWQSSVTGSMPRDEHAPGSCPTRRRRRPRPAAGGHQRGLRARPAVAPGADPCPRRPGALRGFLRRGSLTDARSRNTSRIGVPSNPNVSRSRFSR